MKHILTLALICLYIIPSIGQQVVDGDAGKIWWSDDKLFVNIVEQGVLVIDNKNPSNPIKLGFIEIPGNVDIAVKGDMLYANNYNDLVAINISNLKKIKSNNVLRFDNIFSQYVPKADKEEISFLPPSKKRWMSTSIASFSSSKGGSMACFSIQGDYLYTIDQEKISTFSIKNEKRPEKIQTTVNINGDQIETVFTNNDRLYIGAQKGMYIFGLDNPEVPEFLGQYQHTQSCDPVVVEGKYAYLTLRDGTECNHKVNRLEVIDVSNPRSPKRISSKKMTHPHGLAVENGMVYLCDGRDGLKVIDATNPRAMDIVKRHDTPSSAYDVINIPGKNLLIMVSSTQITQYNYKDIRNLKHLSDVKVNL